MNPASDRTPIRVRMYNVGFGDCFLFYIPDGCGGTQLVLLDFGQHLSGKVRKTTVIAKDIAEEAKAIHGHKRIDVVIATHRHFDHISGFDLKAMEGFEVGEVWLPWTENPADPVAVDLKTKQHELALALQHSVSPSASEFGFVMNSLSNDGAMATLQSGFLGAPTRRYLPTTDPDEATFVTDALPATRVHVLGPSRDPRIIRTLHPPKGEYFEFVGRASVKEAVDSQVFADKFCLTDDEHVELSPHLHHSSKSDRETERKTIQGRAGFDAKLAAQGLEDAINGTSLFLVLEVGSSVLVLAGDAEWGTWSVILEDERWRALLSRTTLYKVSHHGSYNGTPTRFVNDLLPEDAISLVSLTEMERWPSIPRRSLMDELDVDERWVVRSDAPTSLVPQVSAIDESSGDDPPLWIDVEVPTTGIRPNPTASP